MADFLVKLYELDKYEGAVSLPEGVIVKAPLTASKHKVVKFVKETFGEGWADQCDASFSHFPTTCVVALEETTKEVIGFACCEATYKCYFGPMGVAEKWRGKGIGGVLLIESLKQLKNLGYAYGIIGSAAKDAENFYKRICGAVRIEGSEPSIYKNLIR